jgi:hypothetical protein
MINIYLQHWKPEELHELRRLLKSAEYEVRMPNGRSYKVPVYCRVIFDRKRKTIDIVATQGDFSPERLNVIFDVVDKLGGYIQERTEMFLTGIPKKIMEVE